MTPLDRFASMAAPERKAVLERARVHRSLEAHVRAVCPWFKWRWHHVLLADRLTALARGEITRLAVLMPPRHGKTELCSKQFPAWLLGGDPDVKILGVAHKISAAADYNRAVQRMLEDPEYQRLYPLTRLRPRKYGQAKGVDVGGYVRTDELFEIVGHVGSYRSAGIQTGVAGSGANIIVIDDPVKTRQEADSPVIRRKIRNEYTAGIYTRRENYRGADARILLVQTRWHEDDLAGWLLSEENPEEWEVIDLPAILDREPSPGDPRARGEALWPEKQSAEQWETFRLQSPRDFEALGQQRPSRRGGGIFDGSRLVWYGGPPPREISEREAT